MSGKTKPPKPENYQLLNQMRDVVMARKNLKNLISLKLAAIDKQCMPFYYRNHFKFG